MKNDKPCWVGIGPGLKRFYAYANARFEALKLLRPHGVSKVSPAVPVRPFNLVDNRRAQGS